MVNYHHYFHWKYYFNKQLELNLRKQLLVVCKFLVRIYRFVKVLNYNFKVNFKHMLSSVVRKMYWNIDFMFSYCYFNSNMNQLLVLFVSCMDYSHHHLGFFVKESIKLMYFIEEQFAECNYFGLKYYSKLYYDFEQMYLGLN